MEALKPLDPKKYIRNRRFYGANAHLQEIKDYEVVLAGPADTGKTLAACHLLNRLALEYPGMQAAIIRKTYTSMPGSVLQTFIDKTLTPNSPVRIFGGKHSPSKFIYPNGSTIWIGGMDNPDKVLSSERDVVYVNQLEELSITDWEYLKTRCNGRAGNMPYAQMIGDCNPAAPSHWIKQLAKKGQLTLLEATHKDNPTIFDPDTGDLTESGKLRLKVLQGLTGSRKLRLYHGIWAAPEGAIYDVFDEEKHKVTSFPIPRMWPRFVGVDPYGAYTAAVWVAFDPTTNILNVYREYYQPFGETTPGHVANVLNLSGYDRFGKPLSEAEPIYAWVGGGPSENQFRLDWAAAGIPLIESPVTDVWSGIDKVYDLLSEFKLVIHEDCVNLLSEIGTYTRKLDNKTKEPTNDIENKEAFHLLDALRYIISYLATPVGQAEGDVEINYSPVKIGNY